jgi:hypothetical protein
MYFGDLDQGYREKDNIKSVFRGIGYVTVGVGVSVA